MAGWLISNVRISDGSGRAPYPGSVRVEGPPIAAVTPGPAAPPAGGDTVIDGGGSTLMPGLGGLGDTNLLHLPYHETPTFAWVADGPDAVRRACRLLAREGVDLAGMPEMTAGQLAGGLVVGHVDEHLGSIRSTIGP